MHWELTISVQKIKHNKTRTDELTFVLPCFVSLHIIIKLFTSRFLVFYSCWHLLSSRMLSAVICIFKFRTAILFTVIQLMLLINSVSFSRCEWILSVSVCRIRAIHNGYTGQFLLSFKTDNIQGNCILLYKLTQLLFHKVVKFRKHWTFFFNLLRCADSGYLKADLKFLSMAKWNKLNHLLLQERKKTWLIKISLRRANGGGGNFCFCYMYRFFWGKI